MEESLQRLDEQKCVFDNKQYQHENHSDACQQLVYLLPLLRGRASRLFEVCC